MAYFEKPLGKNVRFLLPSLKLKQPCPGGNTVEQSVHEFLLEHFGGYTATAAKPFAHWTKNAFMSRLQGWLRCFMATWFTAKQRSASTASGSWRSNTILMC